MSTQFQIPSNFFRRDDVKICLGAVEHVEQKRSKEQAPLRENHIVLYAVDVLATLYASFKKWRNHRITLGALADLNEDQLRDIGLTRDENGGYRAFDDFNETRV
jgi:uncharacterized protein YjiS (DUF1127 family)